MYHAPAVVVVVVVVADRARFVDRLAVQSLLDPAEFVDLAQFVDPAWPADPAWPVDPAWSADPAWPAERPLAVVSNRSADRSQPSLLLHSAETSVLTAIGRLAVVLLVTKATTFHVTPSTYKNSCSWMCKTQKVDLTKHCYITKPKDKKFS